MLLHNVTVALKGFDAGPCLTLSKKLWGGEGYTTNTAIKLVQKYGISEEAAQHFATTYGVHAFEVCARAKPTGRAWPRFGAALVDGYPYDECEVEWAVTMEYARTVTDVLTLRTRLAYLNSQAARHAAPRVAELMAAQLGWSEQEQATQLLEALEALEEFGGPIAQTEGVTDVIPQLPTDLQALFKLLDADGNEYIDLEEMKHGARLLGFPFVSDERAKEAFAEMDREGSGRVTEADFTHWWMMAEGSGVTDSGGESNSSSHLRQALAARFGFSKSAVQKARGVMFG